MKKLFDVLTSTEVIKILKPTKLPRSTANKTNNRSRR